MAHGSGPGRQGLSRDRRQPPACRRTLRWLTALPGHVAGCAEDPPAVGLALLRVGWSSSGGCAAAHGLYCEVRISSAAVARFGTLRTEVRVRHEPLTSGQSEPAPMVLRSPICSTRPVAAIRAWLFRGPKEDFVKKNIGDLDTSRARRRGSGLWKQLVQLVEREHARGDDHDAGEEARQGSGHEADHLYGHRPRAGRDPRERRGTHALYLRSGQEEQGDVRELVRIGCGRPSPSQPARRPPPRSRVTASLLSSDANPSGGKVVTYAGWPLYTYVGDSASGLRSADRP